MTLKSIATSDIVSDLAQARNINVYRLNRANFRPNANVAEFTIRIGRSLDDEHLSWVNEPIEFEIDDPEYSSIVAAVEADVKLRFIQYMKFTGIIPQNTSVSDYTMRNATVHGRRDAGRAEAVFRVIATDEILDTVVVKGNAFENRFVNNGTLSDIELAAMEALRTILAQTPDAVDLSEFDWVTESEGEDEEDPG